MTPNSNHRNVRIQLDADTLAAGLLTLPQELRDIIYDLTFTTSSPPIRYIYTAYKPPHLLQVNQASRHLFTQSYYSTTILFECADGRLLSAWFRSLTPRHQDLIRALRYGPSAYVPVPSNNHSGRAFREGLERGSFRGFHRPRRWDDREGAGQTALWTAYP
ncbi:hypothetical protein B0A54_08752 [Friedmanniomyces endolithicus]|uniref:F-box domain-containing protein n=1 Tax=Friedmanniomyces endolithicus TaxID=329885 RepID=A0A4U0US10_9PEZI|nr:hypothetical protein LTR38_005838 [Friedmanniomyces endolithicus]TKA38788.1 hypothetical protein B0A54_08752 [Friedmanniomyces endolithicus]